MTKPIMTENEFVAKLKETPFSRSDYSNLGLDEEFITEKVNAFNPKPKQFSTNNMYLDDPLVRLVENYDVSHGNWNGVVGV